MNFCIKLLSLYGDSLSQILHHDISLYVFKYISLYIYNNICTFLLVRRDCLNLAYFTNSKTPLSPTRLGISPANFFLARVIIHHSIILNAFIISIFLRSSKVTGSDPVMQSRIRSEVESGCKQSAPVEILPSNVSISGMVGYGLIMLNPVGSRNVYHITRLEFNIHAFFIKRFLCHFLQ